MRIIFSILLLSLAVHAQETVLGYAEDIQINGKTFERYQTPKGDNVLIGKDAAKKHGVFLFEKARELLKDEETIAFSFVSVTGFAAWNNPNYDKRLQELAAQQPFGEKFRANPYSDEKTQSFIFQPAIAYRPKQYRHVQFKGGVEMFIANKLGGLGYVFEANHDVIVIPGKSNYFALSAGYGFNRNSYSYNFTDGSHYESIKEAFNENSLIITGRYAMGAGYGETIALHFSGSKGDKGGKRLSFAIVWGLK